MTGYSVILDSKDKSRTILTYKGVNNELGINEVPKRFRTKWLYYSSFLGKSFETQKKLARKMIDKGTKLAFNPSMYLIKRKNLSSLLKMCKVLILNKEEAIMLLKKNKVKIKLEDNFILEMPLVTKEFYSHIGYDEPETKERLNILHDSDESLYEFDELDEKTETRNPN